jgi:hypothetical protein
MLPQLTNLVKGLAGAFDSFSQIVERTTRILTMFDDWMENFYELTPQVQSGLQTLALAFAAFGTSVGRSMLPLTMAFALLDELAAYNAGGNTVFFGKKTEEYTGLMSDPNSRKPVGGLEQALGFNLSEFKNVPFAPLQLLSGIEEGSRFFGKKLADWNHESITLTPEAQIDAISKQMAWGKLDYFSADLSPLQKPNYTINVQTNSDNPHEHGMLIMRTMQNMSTGE